MSQRQRQKKDYDRRHGVGDLPQLSEGTDVWIVDLQKEGVIRGSPDEPRSYWVDSGETSLRRNRTNLVPLPPISLEDGQRNNATNSGIARNMQ
ncbi:hypothetical protein MTO96_022025 [Rhipicephalus appendiculatus]